MRIPYTVSDESLSMFLKGQLYTLPASHSSFDQAVEELKKSKHDEEQLLELATFKKAKAQIATAKGVTIMEDEIWFDGKPVHNSLTDKVLLLLEEGFDVSSWANFMSNLMENPSFKSRESLFDFLDHFEAPITDDGCFIAFKRVRSDYKDIHSNTFDNSVGQVLTMDRSKVDDDSQRTCSSGLHVCADSYLDGFATSTNNRTVVVKVNPRDVVAVPYDYDFAKMRCCRYEVVSEITDAATIERIKSSSFYDPSYEDDFEVDLEDVWSYHS